MQAFIAMQFALFTAIEQILLLLQALIFDLNLAYGVLLSLKK